MTFTAKPVSKNLIKYNSNELKESDADENEPIDTEFTERMADPDIYDNAIDLWWSDVQWEDEEHIVKANWLRTHNNKLMTKVFT